jgi:LuxR family transcriptional regulator, maltose regulon positive regulatory protein
MRSDLPQPRRNGLSGAERPARFDAPIATHVVDRPRLCTRLTEGLDAGTVLVAATAGWGKTLLAASWVGAAAGGLRTAWVSLDRTDDEHAFWRTLATALLGVADETAREGLRRVAAPGAADLPSLFVTAVRRLQRKVVLVLDNLHEVAPEVQAGLLQLVERPLPMLSLVVTTRCDPPWPLQRLRLAGLLSDVRAADLAFRIDEALCSSRASGSACRQDRSIGSSSGRKGGRPHCGWPLCACATATTSSRRSTPSPATTTTSPAT